MRDRIATLRRHLSTLRDYLAVKLEQEDWHGVADAAMDIREIEAVVRVLESKKR